MTAAEGALLLWIQDSVRAPWLNPAVAAFTRLGDKGVLWIALTLALICFRRTRKLGLICALALLLGLAVTNGVLKNWVARVRPYETIGSLRNLVGPEKDLSFPSGHATAAFAFSWVLLRRAPKKYGVPALIVAVLISLSRLYVGVHYPSDVLAGTVIGILCAELALLVARILEKRYGRRYIRLMR